MNIESMLRPHFESEGTCSALHFKAKAAFCRLKEFGLDLVLARMHFRVILNAKSPHSA